MIPMEFEGEAIEEIDTAFPPILAGLHLLDSERGMPGVLNENSELPFKRPLDALRELHEVSLEGVGPGYLHALRSSSNSSTVSKVFISFKAVVFNCGSLPHSPAAKRRQQGSI